MKICVQDFLSWFMSFEYAQKQTFNINIVFNFQIYYLRLLTSVAFLPLSLKAGVVYEHKHRIEIQVY